MLSREQEASSFVCVEADSHSAAAFPPLLPDAVRLHTHTGQKEGSIERAISLGVYDNGIPIRSATATCLVLLL